MRKIGKRIWSLLIFVLLVVNIVLGNILPVNAVIVTAATNAKGSTLPDYVALGDSIATGYGLPGYRVGTTPAEAYASIVGNALGGKLQNLAQDGLNSTQFLAALKVLQSPQTAYLSQVRAITLSIGSNDVLQPFMEVIADKLGCNVNEVQTKLAALTASNPTELMKVLALLDAKDGTGLKNNTKLQKAATAFSDNFQEIIAFIKALAPNADIYVTNAYNPYEGVSLSYGLGTLMLGEISDTYIRELNKAFTVKSTDYTLIDVYSTFSTSLKSGINPVNINVSTFNFDPHPNVIGHQLIANEILSSYTTLEDISLHWAKEAIDYAISKKLLYATSASTFSPEEPISRGALVMALGKLAEVNAKDYKNISFSDVAADKEYAPYAQWAYKKNIISGITGKKFGPDKAITREEMVLILFNYIKETGYTLPVTRQAVTYADASEIGSTYGEAVKALQQAGIVMSREGNKFFPKKKVTRGEAAAMLYRYIKLKNDPSTAQKWAVNDSGQHLYYKEGKAITGWKTIDGKKYYFDSNGIMQEGWMKDKKGNVYYLTSKGALVGWQTISDGDKKKRYYFTKDAIMVSGQWLEIDGKWYYFQKDGSLAVNTTIDGYKVDKNGVRVSK